MKIIKIEDGRKLNVSCLVVGYLEENKIEKLQFEIPEEYKDFGRKACFKANDKTFAKSFDNITDNTLTLTRDMTQYNELEMSIAFFKIENEDEIVARTSILKIYIENAIVCDDDIKPDEPKVVILDGLIQKVTELNEQVTKDEEIRQNQETTRQQNETVRQENETVRETNEQDRIKNELARKKAEEERKTNENAREEYISNLKTQVDNGEFDGADFNYKWDDTKLGVKNSKETTYQFVELKGDKGDKGDTGNGIQNIEKVSTVENVDTYAIHYTDGTQTTFDVTNGEVTKEQLDEVDNRAKKTRNELERVKNDILETGTASDSFINVQDSAWAELQELSVDGVCEQQTTTGKNLLPNKVQSKTVNGITCTNNNDGTVILNGTTTAKTYLSPFYKDFISLSLDGNYTFSANTYNNLGYSLYHGSAELFFWDTKSDKTFSATGSFDNVRPQINIESGVTLNNVIVKFQLEKGSTATEYEPYTEGQATPSPDYPQEIKTITDSLKLTSCNKNLFDGIVEDGSIDGQTGENINSTTIARGVNYIPVEENKQYIFSINNVIKQVAISYYDKNYNFITTQLNYNTPFTPVKKSKYIRIRCFQIDYTLFTTGNIQIEQGTTVTSYVDHLYSQITAKLPEGEFIGKIDGTYKDTLKVVYREDGKHHLVLNNRISKVVLNGTQPISYSKVINDDKFVAQFNIGAVIKSGSTMISDKFTYLSNGWASNSENISTGGSSNNLLQIKISQSRLEEVSNNGFNNWLSTHNTEVYYALEKPYEVDLGIVDMPLSYNEVTNIFTDSDLLPQINAKYYRNFTKTVQNLQVNEKALKQELIDINNRLTALETAKVSESEVNNDIPVE
jgi:hypothetical protein